MAGEAVRRDGCRLTGRGSRLIEINGFTVAREFDAVTAENYTVLFLFMFLLAAPVISFACN